MVRESQRQQIGHSPSLVTLDLHASEGGQKRGHNSKKREGRSSPTSPCTLAYMCGVSRVHHQAQRRVPPPCKVYHLSFPLFCNCHIAAHHIIKITLIIIINCCCVVEYCTKTLDHDVRCMVYVEEDKEMHIAEFDGTILSISIEVCSCVLVVT